jgi:hypothetical protein
MIMTKRLTKRDMEDMDGFHVTNSDGKIIDSEEITTNYSYKDEDDQSWDDSDNNDEESDWDELEDDDDVEEDDGD